MLERDGDDAGEIVRHPRPGEFVGRLSIEIGRPRPSLWVCRLGSWIEPERRIEAEVTLFIDHRVMCARMFVVTLWQKDDRPDLDRVTPEFCEHIALNFDVLDVLGVGRDLHRWYRLRQIQMDIVACRRVQMNALRFAVEISR